MSILTVRNLDPGVHQGLRELAARNGRSMEAEARAILAAAVREGAAPLDVFEVIQQHFGDIDLTDLEVPERTELPREVDLDGADT